MSYGRWVFHGSFIGVLNGTDMFRQLIRNRIYSKIEDGIQNRKFQNADDTSSVEVSPPMGELINGDQMTLYLHFPFCDIACKYCRFSKNINQTLIQEYCECLLEEIRMIKKEVGDRKVEITSVYFGGGTPSLMPVDYMKQVIDLIKKTFYCKDDLQFTLECHPQSLNKDSVSQFSEAGINRLSIGVQSFKPEVLKEMGRPLDADYIKEILGSLKDQHYMNFNVDLIYGFDSQDLNSFMEDLEMSVRFGAGHITIFPLIRSIKEGDEELKEKQEMMYEAARKYLKSVGYNQYSVEDFSKDDEYKINYQVDAWGVPAKDLILLGTSGFGNLDGYYYRKEKNTKKYIQKIREGQWPIAELRKLDQKHEHIRRLIFGLHYIDVDRKKYRERYGVDILKEWRFPLWVMKMGGIIKITPEKISLTESQYFNGSRLWGRVLFSML